MNLKDYKERQEAKAYFRSQSTYYLDNQTLVKDVLICLGIGILVGIGYGLIKMILPVNFTILIIVVGYVVSYLIQRVINHRNIQIAVVAVVSTVLACYVSNVMSLFVSLHVLATMGNILVLSFRYTFSNIITDAYILLSCILAYKMND